MKPTFRLRGKVETVAAFGELRKATARTALYRVLFAAARPLDAAWRRNAPVLSGRLARSGGVVKTSVGEGDRAFARAKRAGFDDVAAVRVKRDTLRATAGSRGFAEIAVGPGKNPEGVQQEYGNVNHAAQPFFRPAVDETAGESRRILDEGVGVELDKAKARAAARVARVAAQARASR